VPRIGTHPPLSCLTVLISASQHPLDLVGQPTFSSHTGCQCAWSRPSTPRSDVGLPARAAPRKTRDAGYKQIEALPPPAHTFRSMSATAGTELLIARGEISKLEALSAPPSERGIYLATLSIMNQDVAIDQQAIVQSATKTRARSKSSRQRLVRSPRPLTASLSGSASRHVRTMCIRRDSASVGLAHTACHVQFELVRRLAVVPFVVLGSVAVLCHLRTDAKHWM
jgi:hypothetical protein